jgi:DNA-binding NtrC family response regulator
MKKIILFADDEEGIRHFISHLLKEYLPEYQIEAFSDGRALKNRLEQSVENVEIVITDKEMPEIDGSEIIKEFAGKLKIPFILQYGGEMRIGEEAIRDGAYSYLRKPYNIGELVTEIKEALNSNLL